VKNELKDSLTVQPIPNWAFFSSFLLIIGAAVLDPWILKKMPADFGQRGDFQSSLRVLGYLPNWMFLSAMVALISQGSVALRLKRTALAIFLTPLLSGVAAACLKPLIRRPDPVLGAEGDWGPAPWGSEWWDGTDLCFPSEHAAVAFGAALAIGRRFPRIMPLVLLGAFGCAATRVYERGHNPSDVAASLLLSLAVSYATEKYLDK
jgi:membrane-associated phospholipid phosphatase